MNILITTLGLLSMIALITYGRLQHFVDNFWFSKAFAAHCDSENKEQAYYANHHWKDVRRIYKKKSKDSGVETSKKQSKKALRLDVYKPVKMNLFKLKSPSFGKISEKEHELYEILARLIRNEYGHLRFFSEIPHLEYQILNGIAAALHPKDHSQLLPPHFKGPISKTHHLTAIPFTNPRLREIYCQILKGGKDFPSLLEFIKLIPKDTCRVNAHHVPEELVAAIFNNKQAANDFITIRNKMHAVNYVNTQNGGMYTKNVLDEEAMKKLIEQHGLTAKLVDDYFNFSIQNTLRDD